jgi:hypothetical protein
VAETPCNDDRECSDGQRCIAGFCEAAPAPQDAGRPADTDGGPAVDPDGGPSADAGPNPGVDAGPGADAGPESDAGPVVLPDAGPTVPEDWWDPSFGSRVAISLENTSDEALDGLPVRITLTNPTLIALAGSGGGAMRFTDGAGTPLVHEIELAASDRIEAWVLAPQLAAANTTDIWLYLEHPTATSSARPAEVWAGYRGVYHLAGNGYDSSSLLEDGTAIGTLPAAPGYVGDAVDFNAGHFDLGTGLEHLRAVPAGTVCSFIRPAALPGAQMMLSISQGGAPTNTSRMALELRDADIYFFGRGTAASDSIEDITIANQIVVDTWSWVCGRYDFAAGEISVLVDGVVVGARTGLPPHAATPDTSSGAGTIGQADLGDGPDFQGLIDELRVSGVARSDAWHLAEYLAMTGQLATLGNIERIIRVPGNNAAPVPTTDVVDVDEDAPPLLIDVLANDVDDDGDALTLIGMEASSLGSLRITPTNQLLFVATAETSGSEQLSYVVGDGKGGAASGTLDLTVNAVDDPPVAANQTVSAFSTSPRSITLGGSDVDTAPGDLVYEIVTSPTRGTLSGHTDGDNQLAYRADQNLDGSDSFTYRILDATGPSATRTITVNIVQWFDTAWDDRVRIDIDGTDLGADLADFPVLVRIDSGRFDLTDIDPGGDDLRFVDDDGVTQLDHEVESWADGVGGDIWVRVPIIEGGVDTDHIWAYHDNPGAPAVENAAGVWGASHAAVWHLDGASDSSGSGANLASTVAIAATGGLTGDASSFSGDVYASDSVALQVAGAYTFSTWVRLDADFDSATSTSQILLERVDSPASNFALMLAGTDYGFSEGGLVFRGEKLNSVGAVRAPAIQWQAGSWHHIAAVGDVNAASLTLFIDGAPAAAVVSFGAPVDLDFGGTTHLGGIDAAPSALGAPAPLAGDLDETRVSTTARSPDWIATEVRSARDLLLTYQPENSQPN